MKQLLLPVLVCLLTGALHAGVEEEFPDFFPKGCDAADGWVALVTLPKITDADTGLLPRIGGDDREWLANVDAAKTAGLVERNKTLLEALERAMSAPVLHSNAWKTFEVDSDEWFNTLPALQGMRIIMLRDAVAARDSGKLKQGMETSLRCAAFELRVCAAESPLIDGLVASTGILVATRYTAGLAGLPDVTPEILRSTAEELERLDRRVYDSMRCIVAGEARWGLRLVGGLIESQEKRRETVLTIAASKQLSNEMKGTAPKTEKVSPEESDYAAVRRVWKTKMPESVSAALEASEKVDWRAYLRTYADWFRALQKADTNTVPAFRASFHPPDKDDPLKGTALEAWFVESEYKMEDMYLKLCTRTACNLRLARIVLLLRMYELNHGRLPGSLKDLVPEFCSSLPVDPYDGKAIRYNSLPGCVWCVGLNLKDENGALEPDKPNGADDELLAVP